MFIFTKDLKSLFKKKPKITNSLNGDAYEFFKGISESGKAVTEKSSMELTAVYACVRVISEAIASLPLGVYMDDNGRRQVMHRRFLLSVSCRARMTKKTKRQKIIVQSWRRGCL